MGELCPVSSLSPGLAELADKLIAVFFIELRQVRKALVVVRSAQSSQT